MDLAVNSRLVDYIGSHLISEAHIPPEIRKRLEGTAFIAREGCFFLDALYRDRGNAVSSMFPDETGYECFVNHIHLDGSAPDACMLLALAVLYAVEIKWRASEFTRWTLRHIVSCDREAPSCVYRCHVVRPGQSWLAADLDSYDELILSACRGPAGPERARQEIARQDQYGVADQRAAQETSSEPS
jgi:hypothetical protein